jgi:phage terminase small subunit
VSEEQKQKPTLTTKQRLFVDYYVGKANGNATKAARLSGYSEKTARSIGQENLTKPDIQAAVQERFKQAGMSAEEGLSRLAGMAKATLEDAFEDVLVVEWYRGEPHDYDAETGEPLPTKWAKRISLEKVHETGLIHFVKKISWNNNGPVIELNDPQGALDKILRAHGVYKDEGAAPQIIIKNYKGLDMEAV